MFGSINAAQTQDDLRATQLLIMFGPHISEPNIIYQLTVAGESSEQKKSPPFLMRIFPM
jgi:hypothetical protein